MTWQALKVQGLQIAAKEARLKSRLQGGALYPLSAGTCSR